MSGDNVVAKAGIYGYEGAPRYWFSLTEGVPSVNVDGSCTLKQCDNNLLQNIVSSSQKVSQDVDCGIEGWNLNDNICQLSRCSGLELTEFISSDIYNYDNIIDDSYDYNSYEDISCRSENKYFPDSVGDPAIECKTDGWKLLRPCKIMCVAGPYNVSGQPDQLKSKLPDNSSNRDVGDIIYYNSCISNYIKDATQSNPYAECGNNGIWEFNGVDNCILNDYNSVLADYNALNFDMIKQDNSDINNIKTQLNLVTSGSNGTNISWSSSDYSIGDNNGGIREGDGVVIRPNPGVATNNVTLYANISKGNESMQKSFALQVAPYNEYSRYVGYTSYQNNGWDWDSTQYYSSEWKNTYTDCATSCKNDRYCMFAFWRDSSGKMCKKFSNVDNKDYGYQNYNDNLRYYKY